MTPVIVDASAVLAWLQREPGAELVDDALDGPGAAVLSVNWAEVLTVGRRRGRDAIEVDVVLRASGFVPADVVVEDARVAADLWEPTTPLSLADRLCLGAARRVAGEGAVVLTTDRAWLGAGPEGVSVRSLRA